MRIVTQDPGTAKARRLQEINDLNIKFHQFPISHLSGYSPYSDLAEIEKRLKRLVGPLKFPWLDKFEPVSPVASLRERQMD